MARLDGTTSTFLEGPLAARKCQAWWCQLVRVKLPKTGPGWTPSKLTASTPGRDPKVSGVEFWGRCSMLQDCSQGGAPDATVHQPWPSTVALLGHWRILCSPPATATYIHLSTSSPLAMRCVDGSFALTCEMSSSVLCVLQGDLLTFSACLPACLLSPYT